MARERLLPNIDDDLGYDTRSSEEQLADLGVVEKKKPAAAPEVEWYGKKGRQRALEPDMISVTKSVIILPKDTILAVGDENYYKLGVPKKGGAKVIAFRPDPYGIKLTGNNRAKRLGSKSLVAWLKSKGVVCGRYRLREVAGGYVATLVESWER